MRVGTFFIPILMDYRITRGVIKISKYSNTIEYNLRTTLDSSGITQLQGQLAGISMQLDQMEKKELISPKEVHAAQGEIEKLSKALSTSLNSQTGLLDLDKFQKHLNSLSLSQLEQSMSKIGSTGQIAFGNMIGQIGRMDTSFKSISSFADKIFNTMSNTVRWGVTASIFQTIQNSLYRAVEYVQELDTSLTNIRIVTSVSNKDMRDFALYANEAAQAIGASTTSFTDAAQLYAQNGFNEEDYTRLAEITTKVANVTQQDTTAVSEQITALMAGYNMSIDQVEESLGGMAVVAAASAADLEELATAEQKVASTANTLGVSQEQLTAQIGTIVSVTRQAPETVGNAMRTLYARIADLQMGETLEDGTTLGNLSGTLADIGINVLDAEGNLRNLGDVLEELQAKWSELSNAQQIALGTQLAGKYQLNPFMALMENAEMYNEQLDMMQNSTGALDEQQAIYMDSMAAKMQQLTTAGEGLITNLFNPDDLKPAIEVLTDVLNLITQMINALGGIGPILTGIGSTATKVFSNQIGQSINNMLTNHTRDSQRQVDPSVLITQMGGVGDASQHTASAQFIQDNLDRQSQMSKEQQDAYNASLMQTINLENKLIVAKEQEAAVQGELENFMRQNSEVVNRITPQGNLSKDTVLFQQTQKQDLKELNGVIDQVTIRINNFKKAQDKLVPSSNKFVNCAVQMHNATDKYSDVLKHAGVDMDAFTDAMKRFSRATTADELEQQTQQARELLNMLKTTARELEGRITKTDKYIGNLESSRRNTVSLDSAVNAQEDNNRLQSEMLASQVRIQNIAALTGSIGQLIFAWQSFQSLGSIWVNADLDAGEKLVQTIEVLIFALPSLLSSVADLKAALVDLGLAEQFTEGQGVISKFKQTFNELKATGVSTTTAIAGGVTAMGTAAKGAAASFGALMAEIWPLLAIGAAIGVVSGIIGAIQQAEEDRVQAIEDAATEATDTLNNLSSARANFDSVFEAYKEGTATTEQLSAAADTLNQYLDDQSVKALAAAGAWDEYAAALDGATDASRNQAIGDLKAQRGEIADSANNAVKRGTSYVEYYEGESAKNDATYQLLDRAGLLGTFTAAYNGQDLQINPDYNMEDAVKAYQELVTYIDGNTEWINTLSDEQQAQIQAVREQAQNVLNNEDLQQVIEIDTQLGKQYAEKYAEDAAFAYTEGMSIADYSEQVQNELKARGEESSDTVVAAFVEGMINSDADFAGALGAADAGNNFATQMAAKMNSENYASTMYDGQTIEGFGEATGTDSDTFDSLALTQQQRDAIYEAAANQIVEQINNSDLSDEDKISLYNLIDWDLPVEDILANIKRAIETGDIEGSGFLKSEGNFDETTSRYQEQTESLNEYDVSDDTLEAYSQNLQSLGEAGERYEELSNQAQAARDAVEEGTEATEEQQQAIDDANDELESYTDNMDDLARDNAQTQKGLERLASSFEEYADILKSGDKSSYEYAEAIGEVKDIMADVLNISSEDISNNFITDNLSDIEALANGDVEALDRLRAAAAQDYLIQINNQGNITPEHLNYLQGKIAEIGSMNVEANATLDDTGFIDTLNNMISSGEMTVGEVQTLLNSLGYEGEVTWKDEWTDVFNLADYKVSIPNPFGGDPFEIGFPEIKLRGKVSVPQIKGGSDTGGAGAGPVKKASSVGGGGGLSSYTPSSKGGGGSGGGGGGGGSGKSYEPKTKDPVEDELDRYERVNAELDTLSNRLEKVADEQERLAGFDVVDNMSKQIGLIKEQIKWQQEKLKIQKEEAQEYRDQLASQYGITYDAEGHIANYADVYKRLLNELNGLINQYNATTTEAGQEALDKQIKDAQDKFDKFNDLIEDYDELVSNSILESEKQIEDFYDQIEDLQIEAFQRAVDSVDNIKDLQETIIDFNAVFTGMDSDSPYRDMLTSLENLKTYWDVATESVDAYYDELIRRNNEAMKNASEQEKQNLAYQNALLETARKQYGQGTFEEGGTGLFDMSFTNLNTMLEQIRQYEETGTSTIFGENAGSMYDVAKDIFDQATSLVEDYEGHIDDLRDAILDAIDEIGEKMEERLETYENINDELDHYASIIEMVSGDEAWDKLNEVTSANINNNQSAIKELQENIKVLTDLRDSMEEGSEEWKAVNELITDQQSELLDKTEETVEHIVEMYERGVNQILDKWIESTGMGDDLDWIAEEWELINRNADYYLDDVNAAYEIQKLQGKYLDLLDQSNDLGIQNKITQQMAQQLEYLREKEKLSEYDVQYANAQLEILQKQIALEEAQRNKSQLKLRRDNQGNYSYVYSADEEDVSGARSDLLDAQNNAYNLSKDQIKQTQDDSLSAIQDARDTLEQIWTNANLTLEEKTKRTQTIIDSLKEYLAGTSEQLSESEKNIINDFIGMCEILTEENSEGLQDIYDQILQGNTDVFDQIDTRWQTSITNWLQNLDDFNASTDDAFQNLVDNFEGYQENLDELGDLANMTFDDMSDSIQNAVDKTNDLANSTSDFINQLKNDAGTIKEYENALAEMTAKIQDAENSMRAYQEQVNKLQQSLTAKEQENANLTNQVKDLQDQLDAIKNGSGSGGGGGSGGSGGGGGGKVDSSLAWGIAQSIWTYGQRSGWGNNPVRSGKLTKAYGSAFARQVQNIINANYRSGKLVNYGSMRYSSYNLIGYDTGGYTGEWNDEDGRVGILHEKELVLNKTDTENILNAVDMIRGMTSLARNGAYNAVISQSGGVIDMSSILGQLPDSLGTTTYQVECVFPNATKVEEIQQAILSLPEMVPQYAYKY